MLRPQRPAERAAKPRAQADERAFTYYARLGRLRDHLLRNLSAPLSAREAAEIAGVSEGYFSAFFRDRVGLCFSDWVRLVRVETAQRLIETANVSITEVALEVGFRDLRTFERAFKSTVSITPREFKKRVRPSHSLQAGPNVP